MESRSGIKRFFTGQYFGDFNKSLVVLANPKTIINDRYAKKEIKDQIVRADQLISVMKKMIKESNELSSSRKDMLSMAERVLGWNVIERKDYFAKYQSLYEETLNEEISDAKTVNTTEMDTNETIICPRCGGNLVKRTGKYGSFYGCSSYPKCRYTLKIAESNGKTV